jgi:hypothetical protein
VSGIKRNLSHISLPEFALDITAVHFEAQDHRLSESGLVRKVRNEAGHEQITFNADDTIVRVHWRSAITFRDELWSDKP